MSLGVYDDLGQQEGGGIQACREVHKGRVTTFSGVKKIKIKFLIQLLTFVCEVV